MENEKKYYAGIGSRKTPPTVLDLMTRTARFLYCGGYTLRSGGAIGADSAFELGSGGENEIFLPFEGYNKNRSKLFTIPDAAFEIAAKLHPAWDRCTEVVRKYHARNVLIIYGQDLQTYCDFVICWTRKGLVKGGTGMAIRIAQAADIPIFNLAKQEEKDKITEKIKNVS